MPPLTRHRLIPDNMNASHALAHIRAQLEYYLGAVVARHLRPVTGGPAAWLPRAADGQPSLEQFALPGALCLPSFMGFTAKGVVLGVTETGLQTRDFAQLPVEDLHQLDQWMAQARARGVFPQAAVA